VEQETIVVEGRETAVRGGAWEVRVIGVLTLASALRLLVVGGWVKRFGATYLFTRGLEMGWLAQSLLQGKGLSSPFGVPTGPTAFIAPVYPLMVAAIFKVFGVDSAASAYFMLGLQIVANLVTIWLLMHLGRKLFGERAALMAGIFWALSPPLLYLPTIFWETSFSICLLLGLVAVALWVQERSSMARWAAFGAYGGLMALVNPALLLTLIAVAIGTALVCLQQRSLRVRDAGLGLLMFVLVFCTWPIRNARVFHTFIPLRTTVGFELWMGNREGSTGFLDESSFPAYNKAELTAYKAEGEVAYTNGKSELAKSYIVAHPEKFIALSARRFARFWLGSGTQGGSPLFIVHAVLTTSLGLVGLWRLFRERRWSLALLLAMPLVFFPIPYYFTHAEFRYRVVIDALLTLLAAHAVISMTRPRQLSLDRVQPSQP
jgi:4-amino-4-deoxy-L-arabinose transferase-like glycosyltransferase